MNIESINLVNFQRHSDLNLKFNNGVNVIVGASDLGKSSVRRAISWCLYSENITGVRKEGTKTTSVNITFENEIEIQRVKSSSINRYILRKDGEEKTFDSIGRSIPEEIKEVLGNQSIEVDGQEINLNVSNQLDAPFLIGKEYSGSFRLKLFNKLTGSDLIDKAVKSINKKNRDNENDIKNLTSQNEEKEAHLLLIEKEHKTKENLFEKLNFKFKKLEKLQDKFDELTNTRKRLRENELSIKITKDDLRELGGIADLMIDTIKEKNDRLESLKTAHNALLRAKSQIKDTEVDLSKVRPVSIDFTEYKSKIDRFDMLNLLKERINRYYNSYTDISDELQVSTAEIYESKEEYKKLLKECKVCPLCKQETNHE